MWNEVEQIETRINSQTAREIVVALPHELPKSEQVALVREFAREQFVEQGMIADIAIHAPSAEGDDRNDHAHIMLTTRNVDGDGFTTKNRDWNNKQHLETWREKWADVQNEYLHKHDIDARVDHRTLKSQFDDIIAQANDKFDLDNYSDAADLYEKAVPLHREPQPQLSRNEYQAQRRDHTHPARLKLDEWGARIKAGVEIVRLKVLDLYQKMEGLMPDYNPPLVERFMNSSEKSDARLDRVLDKYHRKNQAKLTASSKQELKPYEPRKVEKKHDQEQEKTHKNKHRNGWSM